MTHISHPKSSFVRRGGVDFGTAHTGHDIAKILKLVQFFGGIKATKYAIVMY